jgi:hypothetical protein
MIVLFVRFSKVACDGRHKFLFKLQRAADALDRSRPDLARSGEDARRIPIAEICGSFQLRIAQAKFGFPGAENFQHVGHYRADTLRVTVTQEILNWARVGTWQIELSARRRRFSRHPGATGSFRPDVLPIAPEPGVSPTID